ncbi:MAG: carbohydrate ABC transporter permease [Verrucomicrobia bacterium]|nr:carbohydrate ABC transporter permease [Verrucomicrobiota bacterium]
MKRKHQDLIKQAFSTFWVGALGLLFAYPFLWMAMSAFKENNQIFQPLQFWPANWNMEYFRQLTSGEWIPFWKVLINSLIIALGQSLGAVFLTSLAGFTFAKHRFRGRGFLFVTCLCLIVLPRQMLAIPLFQWIHKVGLYDSMFGVILPGMASGLGVLYFTQVFKQMPNPYLEAARIEGAGEWRTYWLVLPLLGSSLLSYGLIHFILAWNEHLVPMLVLNTPDHQTLPLALSSLYGSSLRFPYAVLMAGSFMAMIPTTIFFLISYRRFKNSLANVLNS